MKIEMFPQPHNLITAGEVWYGLSGTVAIRADTVAIRADTVARCCALV